MLSSIVVCLVAFLFLVYVAPQWLSARERTEAERGERREARAQLRAAERRVAPLLVPTWVVSPRVSVAIGVVLFVSLATFPAAVIVAAVGVTSWFWVAGTGAFVVVSAVLLRRIEVLRRYQRNNADLKPIVTGQTPEVPAPRASVQGTDDAPTAEQRDAIPRRVPAVRPVVRTPLPDAEPGQWTPRPVPPPLYSLKASVPRPKPAVPRPAPQPAAATADGAPATIPAPREDSPVVDLPQPKRAVGE